MRRPRNAHMRAPVHRLNRALAATRGAFVLALAIVLLATGGHLLHAHDEHEGAGLYNEAHVLAGAAARTADAPVPSAPPAQAIAAVVSAAPPTTRPIAPAAALRRAESRAPPSA
jgi:hypothetical protein